MPPKKRGIALAPAATPGAAAGIRVGPKTPAPSIDMGFAEPRAITRPDGTIDFGVSDSEWAEYHNFVTLIKDKNSKLFSSGKRLVEKMRQIQSEGQVYYWKIDPKKRYTAEQQKEYEARKKIAFVKFGDGSNATLIPQADKTKDGKPKPPKKVGAFDSLVKWDGTTNCSTAVLDALYRTLGGKVDRNGEVLSIGGVNGIGLDDASFSGFNHMFQGPDWADALEKYGLGYKVNIEDITYGDIIGTGGHRMVYLETIKERRDGTPIKIKAIQANLPTGDIAIKEEPFKVAKHWKIARLFDLKE
jgi:hypothetical protein